MNSKNLTNLSNLNVLSCCIFMTLVGTAYAVVSPPVFSPSSAQTSIGTAIIATSATSGATIYYTINGANPTVSDLFIASGNSISIPRSLTLKAMAWSAGVASTVTTANYKVVGQIAAGAYQGIALKSNRYPFAWGFQSQGNLGDITGAEGAQPTPARMKVTSTDLFSYGIEVAAGNGHSAVIDNYGRVSCYGVNTDGQLGDGTTTTPWNYLPRLAWTNYQQELQGCVQVVAANTYTAALDSSGFVYTWGGNFNGRLGRISPGFYAYAGLVQTNTSPYPSLSGIVQIATGDFHMLARTAHSYELAGGLGSVWVWGLNSSGQLGTGNTTTYTRATKSTLLTNISDISAGPKHSAVVKWNASTPGWVYCFGQRELGRLGNNLTTAGVVSSPVQVLKSGGVLDQIVAVAAGPQHTLALDSTGYVWAWGSNLNGELGDNSAVNRGIAAKVKNPSGTADLSNIVNIAAGGVENSGFSFATAADGTVYAWGCNLNGQLGIGNSVSPKLLPVAHTNLKLTNQGSPTVVLAATASQDFEPAMITLSCSVTDIDGTDDVPYVSYYNGITLLANKSSSDIYSLTNMPSGSYPLSVVAVDFAGLQSTSSSTVVIRSTISVQAVGPSASEDSLSSGVFRISRRTMSSDPLQLSFSLSGAAINGTDYTTLPASIQIPANQKFVDLVVVGTPDGITESSEDVILTLLSTATTFPNPDFASASVKITDIVYDPNYDTDGLSTLQELALGTSPLLADTDGDGVNDALDPFPLDATRWAALVPISGDVTRPTVTLQAPLAATYVTGP